MNKCLDLLFSHLVIKTPLYYISKLQHQCRVDSECPQFLQMSLSFQALEVQSPLFLRFSKVRHIYHLWSLLIVWNYRKYLKALFSSAVFLLHQLVYTFRSALLFILPLLTPMLLLLRFMFPFLANLNAAANQQRNQTTADTD